MVGLVLGSFGFVFGLPVPSPSNAYTVPPNWNSALTADILWTVSPILLVKKIRGARPVHLSDYLMILEATLYPVLISIGSQAFGIPRVQGALRRWSINSNPARIGAVDLIRDARRAQRIVKMLTGIGGNCLVRSLTLWTMLLRRSLSTELRVGFRKRDGRIEGHAWLEHEGTPINEAISETLTYQPYDHPMNYDYLRSHL
jgi:hypothetical protein